MPEEGVRLASHLVKYHPASGLSCAPRAREVPRKPCPAKVAAGIVGVAVGAAIVFDDDDDADVDVDVRATNCDGNCPGK